MHKMQLHYLLLDRIFKLQLSALSETSFKYLGPLKSAHGTRREQAIGSIKQLWWKSNRDGTIRLSAKQTFPMQFVAQLSTYQFLYLCFDFLQRSLAIHNSSFKGIITFEYGLGVLVQSTNALYRYWASTSTKEMGRKLQYREIRKFKINYSRYFSWTTT